ncbi:hypothetical protein H5986_09200, partial [Fusobacterium mortiferum]|nr:hypothetical protein [Fusobacterium mortiferum]
LNYAINKTTNKVSYGKSDLSLEHFFNPNFFDDKKIEIDTDELFGLDTQI